MTAATQYVTKTPCAVAVLRVCGSCALGLDRRMSEIAGTLYRRIPRPASKSQSRSPSSPQPTPASNQKTIGETGSAVLQRGYSQDRSTGLLPACSRTVTS